MDMRWLRGVSVIQPAAMRRTDQPRLFRSDFPCIRRDLNSIVVFKEHMTTDSNPLRILGRPDLLRRFNLSLPRAGGSGLEPKWTLRHSHHGFPDIGRVSIIKRPIIIETLHFR